MSFHQQGQIFTNEEVILLSFGLRIALFSKDNDPKNKDIDYARSTYVRILKKLQNLTSNKYIVEVLTEEIERFDSGEKN